MNPIMLIATPLIPNEVEATHPTPLEFANTVSYPTTPVIELFTITLYDTV